MEGKVIIFTAPSGAGKTTIVHRLLEKISSLSFSISATTRAPRNNERNGLDYYFLSKQDFEEKIKAGEILEWQEVYPGAFYGTLKSEVERIWDEGKHVIFDVEVIGGKTLKKSFGQNALSIFVKVNDIEILRDRLLKRNTESIESLNERVKRASMEMQQEQSFDAVILNHDLKLALKNAEELVTKFLN
ncbi:MAG: guanylate kinase [Bacteroidota bacterium]